MAKIFWGSEVTDRLETRFDISDDDLARVVAHGARRFGTQDAAEINRRFGEVFMGNLMADVVADEQNIAAAAARASVAPIVATPE
jgi:hypothetical protein